MYITELAFVEDILLVPYNFKAVYMSFVQAAA